MTSVAVVVDYMNHRHLYFDFEVSDLSSCGIYGAIIEKSLYCKWKTFKDTLNMICICLNMNKISQMKFPIKLKCFQGIFLNLTVRNSKGLKFFF